MAALSFPRLHVQHEAFSASLGNQHHKKVSERESGVKSLRQRANRTCVTSLTQNSGKGSLDQRQVRHSSNQENSINYTYRLTDSDAARIHGCYVGLSLCGLPHLYRHHLKARPRRAAGQDL